MENAVYQEDPKSRWQTTLSSTAVLSAAEYSAITPKVSVPISQLAGPLSFLATCPGFPEEVLDGDLGKSRMIYYLKVVTFSTELKISNQQTKLEEDNLEKGKYLFSSWHFHSQTM